MVEGMWPSRGRSSGFNGGGTLGFPLRVSNYLRCLVGNHVTKISVLTSSLPSDLLSDFPGQPHLKRMGPFRNSKFKLLLPDSGPLDNLIICGSSCPRLLNPTHSFVNKHVLQPAPELALSEYRRARVRPSFKYMPVCIEIWGIWLVPPQSGIRSGGGDLGNLAAGADLGWKLGTSKYA